MPHPSPIFERGYDGEPSMKKNVATSETEKSENPGPWLFLGPWPFLGLAIPGTLAIPETARWKKKWRTNKE